MADFYRQTYGPAAEFTGGLIQVPSYFAWIALQYSALAGLLELYFAIPFPVGLFIVASITLAYTLIGGMWSVTLTDSFQILVAIAGLIILTSDPKSPVAHAASTLKTEVIYAVDDPAVVYSGQKSKCWG